MEQTVNTFSKGLQLDTHPMVQGNESLSDALNATMVTMNGNEVILQNDMGNRRVDHAYLPPGYTPVGMKEYGGIIYIAAYNPITNMSQVGSFPSPELYISKVDDSNLGNSLDLCNFINNNSLTGENLGFDSGDSDFLFKYIKNDSLLIPLTSDISLHIGDKFIVYDITNYIWKLKDYIFDNGNKKMFIFQLGILNSQNEFVDITDSLVYWNENGNIVDESYSGNKFFIRPGVKNGTSLDLPSISDGKLVEEREISFNTCNANTYAYKLAGPLYLKVSLVHVTNFNYTIKGNKNEDGSKVTLFVTGYYKANGPFPSNIETKHPSILDFDFKIKGKDLTNADISSKNPKIENDTLIIEKEYKFNISDSDHELTYYINVPVLMYDSFTESLACFNNNKLYLEGLRDTGIIDIDLFGSGIVKLLGYRYFNNWDLESNDAESILLISIAGYPRVDLRFYGAKVEFYNVIEPKKDSGNNIIPDGVLTLNEHEFSILKGKYQFSWKNEGLDLNPRELYELKFTYYSDPPKTTTDDPGAEPQPIDGPYFIDTGTCFYLTTRLFNNCFISTNKNDFVPDFRDFSKAYAEATPIVQKYLTITPEIIAHIDDKSKEENRPTISPLIDNIANIQENMIKKEFVVSKKLDIRAWGELKVDETNYPKYFNRAVDYRNELTTEKHPITSVLTTQLINEFNDGIKFKNSLYFTDNNKKLIKFENNILSYKDIYAGQKGPSELNVTIKNCFSTVLNYYYTMLDYSKDFFAGVSLDWIDPSNGHTKSVLKVIWDKLNEKCDRSLPDHDENQKELSTTTNETTNIKIIKSHIAKTAEGKEFKISEFYDTICETFEEWSNPGVVMFWIYNNIGNKESVENKLENIHFSETLNNYSSNNNKFDGMYSRVWIKGISGKWVLASNLLLMDTANDIWNDRKGVVKNQVIQKYINPLSIVCCSDTLIEHGFYGAVNSNYNKKYEFNIPLTYEFKFGNEHTDYVKISWNPIWDNASKKLDFLPSIPKGVTEIYNIPILSSDKFLEEVLKLYSEVEYNNVCKIKFSNGNLQICNLTDDSGNWTYIFEDINKLPLSHTKVYYLNKNDVTLYNNLSDFRYSGLGNDISLKNIDTFRLLDYFNTIVDTNGNKFYYIVADTDKAQGYPKYDCMFHDSGIEHDVYGNLLYDKLYVLNPYEQL